MSLTQHQKCNTILWQALRSTFNDRYVRSVVGKINRICRSKPLFKFEAPQTYDYPLAGHAAIYAYIFKYYPDQYRSTIAGRKGEHFDLINKETDPVKKAIMAGLEETLLRHSSQFSKTQLKGISSLPAGSFSGNNLLLYRDIENIYDSIVQIENESGDDTVAFQVAPLRAQVFGGADIQMQVGTDMIFMSTTFKAQPMTIEKMEQALAYYILDLYLDGEILTSTHSWQDIVFYFTRQNEYVRIDPLLAVDPTKVADVLSKLVEPPKRAFHSQDFFVFPGDH